MMLSPKEKANQLAMRFITKSVFDMTNEELKLVREQAKHSAKVCADEIIYELGSSNKRVQFWKEVVIEVDKLHS